MSTAERPSARIRFLAPTHDGQGRMIHHPGEIIHGELFARHQDFLLIWAHTGTWMYVDLTRTDLYHVEMRDAP